MSFSNARLFSKTLDRFLGKHNRTKRQRRQSLRRSLVEQLESRQLLALNILSVTPPDGTTDAQIDTDLVIQFNEAPLKGQGNIHIVEEGTGTLGVAVDVTSPNVQINGNFAEIDLPVDLQWETNYYVLIDDGAFKDTNTALFANSTLLVQDFELLPLQPFIEELGGDGTDFTLDPPLGFAIDNSNMAGPGRPEWQGWSFADKNSWIEADNQSRDQFTLGQGTVAIADPDEWDDNFDGSDTHGNFNSIMESKPILLDGVTANSLQLVFDSSYRPEDQQIGTLDVTFDDGTNWINILTYDSTQMTDGENINETLTLDVDNPSTGTAKFRWQMIGGNDWWWAIDNLRVSGEIAGETFKGLSDPEFWQFSTPEEPILSVGFDALAVSENGGTAIGTVSRNLDTTDPLTVTLVSSDLTEATVPAEVTIPAGQASATFIVTAVDDTELDRNQLVTITASNATYTSGEANITILDDELPFLVSTNPVDNSTGVDYLTPFSATFDTNIKKGHGRVYIVDAASGVAEYTVDVNDASVTITGGNTLEVPSQGRLAGLTDYYIFIDDGAILDDVTTVFPDATLLVENFDVIQLGPATTETVGDGTDWTDIPPLGFSTSENLAGDAGRPEWAGWSFADTQFWYDSEDGRDRFDSSSGNAAIADRGAWADTAGDQGRFAATMITPAIDLSGVEANSVILAYDSSYSQNSTFQFGNLDVTFDDGASWATLESIFASALNERRTINVNNPTSGTMRFRFDLGDADGANSYWAIDNVLVTGDTQGLPYTGIQDPAGWNFTTGEAGTITVSASADSAPESGGTLTGTVTRNLDTSGAIVIDLASSDTSEVTVPAQVTIPDGQASAEFVITLIDDDIADGSQFVTITATPPAAFFDEPVTIEVLDDDFPVITEFIPADDSTGVALDSTFSATFDQPIKKGNGFIHILRSSDGKTGISLDVNSPQVTILDNTVHLFPTIDLTSATDYYVSIDDGAILGTAEGINEDVTLLMQDFEVLPLGPAVDESGGDGTDF
ncbi:MAG TPA: hypothetical protein DDW52_30120, partial [Planctomycetaceae bacterium]|nr:hypothetical protein [Planctomycetaceae bacterium]